MSKLKHKHPPRDTPSRDDRYMGLAWMWASMSKDPSTQVGAVIIGIDNRPLGSGYNGPPRQINDMDINWVRPDKQPFIVHAEINAIDHCSGPLKGATIYVTGIPCPDCMLGIVKSGIQRIVYHNYKSDSGSMMSCSEKWELTQQIAKMGSCNLDLYKGNLNWMRDWVDFIYAKGIFG